MGNRYLLKNRRTYCPKNQLWLLKDRNLCLQISSRHHCPSAEKSLRRVAQLNVHFYASTPEEYEREAQKRINAAFITREALNQSIIEEYVYAKFNANYFWSPLTDDIDLLGFTDESSRPSTGPRPASQRTTRTQHTHQNIWTHGSNHERKSTEKSLKLQSVGCKYVRKSFLQE